MTRRIWIFAALLACCGSVEAQIPRTIDPLEDGYELDLRAITFPSQSIGSINLTPCDGCPRVSHRTTEQTVFLVNGKPTPYEDFLKVVEDRGDTKRLTFVGVHYDIATKVVNRIELKTF